MAHSLHSQEWASDTEVHDAGQCPGYSINPKHSLAIVRDSEKPAEWSIHPAQQKSKRKEKMSAQTTTKRGSRSSLIEKPITDATRGGIALSAPIISQGGTCTPNSTGVRDLYPDALRLLELPVALLTNNGYSRQEEIS
jgi:hypothetical protein